MGNKDFNSSISAKISAMEATQKIGNIPQWWGVTFTGSTEKQNDKFIIKMGEDAFFNFTVTELIPGKRIAWLITDCYMPWYTDKKEWANTRLIFDLHEDNGVTDLHFTHEGLTPDSECYKDCEPGWTHWIKTSLFSYFTTGKGVFKKNKSFTTTIEVVKSPEYIFNCLAAVSKWWSKDFEGNSARLHDEFVICHPGSHYSKHQLIEMIPHKKVVWLVTESELPWLTKDIHEWTNTKMIFDIAALGEKTVLHFTHEGLVPEKECYERCTEGWTMIIKERLFDFITSGKTI